MCRRGQCKSGTGETYCSGTRIDTSNDSANCGQCGLTCPDGRSCIEAICTTQCKSSTGKLIEASLMIDSAHCGKCSKKCSVGEVCRNGKCESGTGKTFCDGQMINTLYNSATNCGQCGLVCPNGVECRGGGCMTQCGSITTSLMDDSANCSQCEIGRAHV